MLDFLKRPVCLFNRQLTEAYAPGHAVDLMDLIEIGCPIRNTNEPRNMLRLLHREDNPGRSHIAVAVLYAESRAIRIIVSSTR